MAYKSLVIEPLNKSHKKSDFRCGESSLDKYLKKQASQDVKRRISRIFVVVEPTKPDVILGYYSLSSLSVELKNLPSDLVKKLPKVPVPAALIGRLAVGKQAQGYGIGKMLLVDGVKRTLSVSKQVAIYAMVVDVINEEVSHFYQQFGFIYLNASGSRLFLPLKSLS